jgi:hypothetical protein
LRSGSLVRTPHPDIPPKAARGLAQRKLPASQRKPRPREPATARRNQDRPAARAPESCSGITARAYPESIRRRDRVTHTAHSDKQPTNHRAGIRHRSTRPDRPSNIRHKCTGRRYNRRARRTATGYTLVFGTRFSPLLEGLGPPPARPRPGPGRSRPRRTNPARTTSRPVTRTSRRTGDPPPTPHHVLGTRRTQPSTRTIPSPDAAGPTGASGDSDTNTKERCNKDVQAGMPGKTTDTRHGAPPGRFRDHRPKPAPNGPGPETRKGVTQCQLEQEPDPRKPEG